MLIKVIQPQSAQNLQPLNPLPLSLLSFAYAELYVRIQGRFLEVLISVYANDKSAVKIDNKLTQFFTCHSGVKQGFMLSPALFNFSKGYSTASSVDISQIKKPESYQKSASFPKSCQKLLSDKKVAKKLPSRIWKGLSLGDKSINCLLYADDLVIFSRPANHFK